MKMTRRQFGKQLFSPILTAAALGFPGIITPPASRSRVVMVRSSELLRTNHQIIKEKARHYLDQALTKLTGYASATTAWKSIVSPQEKVGIKLSCLPGLPLSSSYGLVMAIVDALLTAGVSEKNIIVWERTSRELHQAGFPAHPTLYQCLGTDQLNGDGYSNQIEMAGSVGTRFSQIMEQVDALINVPVLKDHDLCGVSISMKNFYGAIFNPNKYHRNHCDPFIAELNTHPIIKDKLRLIICDATRIQVNNGPAFFPGYAWEYGGLLVGRDPVALDYLGWQLIEERRQQLSLKTLKDVQRFPAYIFTAGKLKLGCADPHHIDIITAGK